MFFSRFIFILSSLLLSQTAVALTADLRASNRSMSSVRKGQQFGGTCYAETAAMATDAYRYAWMGAEKNTYVDSVQLSILSGAFSAGDKNSLASNEDKILEKIKTEGYLSGDPSLWLVGGSSYKTVEVGLERGFCINQNQTQSILARYAFKDSNDKFKSAIENFYTEYEFYVRSMRKILQDQSSDYTVLKNDKTAFRGFDHLIPKEEPSPVDFPYSLDQDYYTIEELYAGVIDDAKKSLQSKDFYFDFTEKDQRNYISFLGSIYSTSQFRILTSVEYMLKLLSYSCKEDRTINQSNTYIIPYYAIQDEKKSDSSVEIEKKKKIVRNHFSLIKQYPEKLQPIMISYCVLKSILPDIKKCGNHAALIVGIQPNANGGHDLIVRNTEPCVALNGFAGYKCDVKTGDEYIEERQLLKSINGMSTIIPYANNSEVNRIFAENDKYESIENPTAEESIKALKNVLDLENIVTGLEYAKKVYGVLEK